MTGESINRVKMSEFADCFTKSKFTLVTIYPIPGNQPIKLGEVELQNFT